MKKQLLRTLTASILLMSTSVLAQQAPSRTECIAPAKPGGGFDLTCKLIQVSLLETGAIEKPMRVTYMPAASGPWRITPSSPSAQGNPEPWLPFPAVHYLTCRRANLVATVWMMFAGWQAWEPITE